jgi:hypothetical protein
MHKIPRKELIVSIMNYVGIFSTKIDVTSSESFLNKELWYVDTF